MKKPDVPEDKRLIPDEVARSAAHRYWGDAKSAEAASLQPPVGMNEREPDEFFLSYGPRKMRKAIEERRKAREQAQTNGEGTP